jgi:hypothetical protein
MPIGIPEERSIQSFGGQLGRFHCSKFSSQGQLTVRVKSSRGNTDRMASSLLDRETIQVH